MVMQHFGSNNVRIDDHDLASLAVRPRRAVQKHGVRRLHHHAERADLGLSVLEGNVPAVQRAGLLCLQRLAALRLEALGDSVVAAAELELHHVAHLGPDDVGHEEVLRPANDDGDECIGGTRLASLGGVISTN